MRPTANSVARGSGPADIVVKGAREHNLREVSLDLPRNQLICLTGVSGSGKSSLAFDTLYAEGQRRYVESLSSYARQFLGQLPKPDVDYIGGLSPSISISQKSAGRNPRSTVGTITEIYDYLRVLMARVGDSHCPQCGVAIASQTREQVIQQILELPESTSLVLLAPIIRAQKGEYRDLFADLLKQGFVRARVDGQIVGLTDQLKLDRQMRHDIDVVVDRLKLSPSVRPRLAEGVDTALRIGQGYLTVLTGEAPDRSEETAAEAPARRSRRSSPDKPSAAEAPRGRGARSQGELIFSIDHACPECGASFSAPSPQLFSFNSPQGMCKSCDGLGDLYSFSPELLVSDPRKSFKRGAIELLGSWSDLGRWRRHIYQGVADTMERKRSLPAGVMLETPWKDLPADLQKLWLWGTGTEHITFTWRNGASPVKYGGHFEGLIPSLLEKYKNSRSRPQRLQLEKYMTTMECPDCNGSRLNAQARAVTVTSEHPRFGGQPRRSLPEICGMPIERAAEFFSQLRMEGVRRQIGAEAIKEIQFRLKFLLDVGLGYLTLDRRAPTLSGGESQRIRLASQIGSGLVGVLYILDEPSIGLHPRDNERLLGTLCRLRDQGNTVVVVEHDEDTMRAADMLIDFGPGPGVRGGEVVVAGSVDTVMKDGRSLTGQYLSGRLAIEIPAQRRLATDLVPEVPDRKKIQPGSDSSRRGASEVEPDGQESAGRRRRRSSRGSQPEVPPAGSQWLHILGARHNNLKNLDISLPLGAFICITGVSGSGKSSLVGDILSEALLRDLNGGDGHPGAFDGLLGLEHLDKMIAIDQSPIGRTPRSNPATYIKVFDEIRQLYAKLPDAKRRGYGAGRFSFNVSGGRCEACEGNGSNRLEMDFLADVWVTCPVCAGHRFNRETLSVRYRDKSISDVLELDVQQALELFENQPTIRHPLQTLHDVGLDYLKLGQPSPTLSGGEAQRIKLARELVKKSTGRTLYLLDEPTTGLHFADIRMLLKVLHDFADAGNTVVVVEHNLDVIKTADWIIDLGPEGGEGGGQIVVVGTPDQIAACDASPTGVALRKVLQTHPSSRKSIRKSETPSTSARRRVDIPPGKLVVRGATEHNLKDVSVELDHHRMSVFCGPSGSGKTSLAMDTIYAEGQRRYVESLSAYARQFVSQMQKPRVEAIEGLAPAIAIQQQNLGHSPRSTVGTTTEIYDYLRVLMARLATPYCPDCDQPVGTQTSDQITDKLLTYPEGTRLYIMAPRSVDVGQQYESLWDELRTAGYARVRVDGQTISLDDPPTIDRRRKHQVEVIVDRAVIRRDQRGRLAESVEMALSMGRGVLHVAEVDSAQDEAKWRLTVHSQHLACGQCGRSLEQLTPHNFSFNSTLGWCPTCEGLGTQVGTRTSVLIRNENLTLLGGAMLLWPDIQQPVSQAMLRALSRDTGIPVDVPYHQLDAKQRRLLMYGTNEQWHRADLQGMGADAPCSWISFQFQGFYPALAEARRLSPALRMRLDTLVDDVDCTVCGGSRLRTDAAAAKFRGLTVDQICRQPLGDLLRTLASWKLDTREAKIAGELLREIENRVQFLVDVGLDYLTLHRAAATLSGGEAQRIRLASQLGSGLCGVLYVLDEPTIGLHPRDNTRLIRSLHKLRDLGNTLVVVEHDYEVIAGCDRMVDFGPGAGRLGGQIVAQGSPDEVASESQSVTGPYLSGKKSIPIPSNRRIAGDVRQSPLELIAGRETITVEGARHHNLQNLTVSFPLGCLVAVTGVSGSGKSSLVNDVLYAYAARLLHRASTNVGPHDRIVGLVRVNKVIQVDQQPLGNSPTSNPATYTGLFDLIRQLFARLPESRLRGYSIRRFSFNVPGGRCEDCCGEGQKCITMHFLPDVWVTCETCQGRRYNPETLAVKYHGQSIADVLDMTCGQALELFREIPKIRRILQTLCDVGLDYLSLGQAAPTLSGGEAQRVKLAAELARPQTGRTLYILDEPTTGLHFDDLAKLLDVLNRLVDAGNTVLVIEHNMDVVKSCDWVIDIGPEAGAEGGRLVAMGTPEQVANYAAEFQRRKSRTTTEPSGRSYTGEALIPILKSGTYVDRREHAEDDEEAAEPSEVDIDQIGDGVAMPWEIDGRRWHTKDRVARNGQPCEWDGDILARVIDKVEASGKFSTADWNSRGVVEVVGPKKSDGWFLHALTGERWLLKLKFRVAKGTFDRGTLVSQLNLEPLNQLDDIPAYSNEPRVKCRNLRTPYQEVEIHAHSFQEIDTPAFWKFVDDAIAGFQRHVDQVSADHESVMPWKKLGAKWHFSRRGFTPGQKVAWEPELLEELCELLQEVAAQGQFLWNNQQVVHVFLPEQKEAWASMYTKRYGALELALVGPKDGFAMGQLAPLGNHVDLDTSAARIDVIKFKLTRDAQIRQRPFQQLLKDHAQLVRERGGQTPRRGS
ncbi:MAG: excinuclease ABC subunit UvrA [Pirellulales bacterium]